MCVCVCVCIWLFYLLTLPTYLNTRDLSPDGWIDGLVARFAFALFCFCLNPVLISGDHKWMDGWMDGPLYYCIASHYIAWIDQYPLYSRSISVEVWVLMYDLIFAEAIHTHTPLPSPYNPRKQKKKCNIYDTKRGRKKFRPTVVPR